MLWSGFSPFHQLAWVTPDLERSIVDLREIYNVPDFYVMDLDFEATVESKDGVMGMRVALAYMDEVQLEFIQPKAGPLARIYTDALPSDGSYRNVFHHICLKIPGMEDDWQSYLASLSPRRRVCFSAEVDPDLKLVYTDERALCGLYVEHLWCGPESNARLEGSIPRFTSAARSPA